MREKTYNLSEVLCIFLVDLDETTAQICSEALDPIRTVRANTSTAVVDILAMRPLLVLIAKNRLNEAQLKELEDAASACGAEVIVLDPMTVRRDDPLLSVRLFEAMRVVERRRMAPVR